MTRILRKTEPPSATGGEGASALTAHDSEGHPRLQGVAATCIIAYLLVATFPGVYSPLGPGLDPSWGIGINLLPHMPVTFGGDVVFTYGPLGFLLVPRDIGANLLWAVAGWLVMHAVLGAVLVYHYRRTRSIWGVSAFAVALLLAESFGLFYEDRVIVLVLLLLTVEPESPSSWRVAAPAASLVAVTLLFTKLTVGLASMAALFVVALSWATRGRAGWRAVLLAVGVPSIVGVIAASFLLFDGPGALLTWLRLSFEIAGGFSEAMSVPEPIGLSLLGAASLALVLGISAWFLIRHPRLWGIALAGAAIAFFAFRHSYVRHHGRFIFSVAVAVVGVLALVATARRTRTLVLASAIPILLVSGLGAAQPECICPWSPSRLAPVAGAERLGSLLRLPSVREELAAASDAHLALVALPDDWVTDMRSAGDADAVPSELSYLLANAITWRPNPVIQTYHAFTRDLDERVALHFEGPEAPDHLLAQFLEIDGRHPLLASPRTWDAILRRYALGRDEPAFGPLGEVVLLERRARPRLVARAVAGERTVRFGRWVEVPELGAAGSASLYFDRSFTGLLASLAWRVDPILLDLEFEDGAAQTIRILPATAGGGLLMRPPRDSAAFVDLLGGKMPPRVSRLRIHGPGAGSFSPTIRIVWRSGVWMQPPD